MSKWISVEDRLPDYVASAGGQSFVHVIACFPGRFVTEAMYCDGVWEALGIVLDAPTHWMPLPEPPNEN